MPPNRRQTVIAIVLISAAVIGGHLLPGFDNSPVDDGIRNGLHVLVFAVVAIIVFERLQFMRMSTPVAVILTTFLATTIGASAELLQYPAGWQSDLLDVLRDTAGAVLALTGWIMWRWSGAGRLSGAARLVVRSISVVVALLVVSPLSFWASIQMLGRGSSPVIIDFEQWWNEYINRPVNAEIFLSGGNSGTAEIALMNWRRSGLVISPMT